MDNHSNNAEVIDVADDAMVTDFADDVNNVVDIVNNIENNNGDDNVNDPENFVNDENFVNNLLQMDDAGIMDVIDDFNFENVMADEDEEIVSEDSGYTSDCSEEFNDTIEKQFDACGSECDNWTHKTLCYIFLLYYRRYLFSVC